MNQVTWGDRQLTPSKIICVGRNYVAHIQELNNPMPDELVLFLKPNSAIAARLVCPPERCRFETEIALLIQDGGVAALGLGLDLTLVEVQQRLKAKGLPWEKAKAFDGAAVFSPFIDAPVNLDNIELRMTIDGELRQEGGVPLMLHKPAQIIAEASQHFSLCDGDIIMTGTPKGVGDLQPQDSLHAQLLDQGTLLLEYQF